MFKFIGIAVLTALITPFSPLILAVGAFRDVKQTGNGADAALSIFAGIGGLIGIVVLAGLALLALANPAIAGVAYGIWCLGVATFFSTHN